MDMIGLGPTSAHQATNAAQARADGMTIDAIGGMSSLMPSAEVNGSSLEGNNMPQGDSPVPLSQPQQQGNSPSIVQQLLSYYMKR